ncbi:ExbD/TolR family protein [Halopseudomonas pelagia]|uniref:Biopolymer transporter ExbD n=1 Tax=Halopseudomonas pelagia TaxID=553151 RepID=A0AA91TZM0_9GAMM|nr:biopolymer transporter ExbD [Halopseudomonas pelagia]PCC97768.1 biopolymer transporter ExbD [Halopseudomonas pelagia]QFY57384.1 biopolymer transporter ExbD [Halopseudomonas pelagia]WOD12916.1 biopolymer transporter ExbD [Pseudomonas sp. NyZ704]
MNFRRKKPDEASVNLTPLIDVVFLLLIFFMVSTTFTRETQLKLDLPQAASGQQVDSAETQQIELVISATGDIAINQKALAAPSMDTLKTALQRESAGDNSLPLIITADAQTPHQAVIMAMDAAGQLGFTRLRLTTSEMGADDSQ